MEQGGAIEAGMVLLGGPQSGLPGMFKSGQVNLAMNLRPEAAILPADYFENPIGTWGAGSPATMCPNIDPLHCQIGIDWFCQTGDLTVTTVIACGGHSEKRPETHVKGGSVMSIDRALPQPVLLKIFHPLA